MLSVQNLHAGYGSTEVIRNLDMTVEEHDIRLIIGPNGVGKTTLLRALYGVVIPSRGTIHYDGQNVTRASVRGRIASGIAYVPQTPSIFPRLTVYDNLLMGLFPTDIDARSAIDATFERFPLLKRRAKTLAQSLSGGERRLLELARALLLQPKMLLLDEPSLGLSPIMMTTILDEVVKINAEGTTVILVEQKIRQALTVAKTISILRLGRIVREGSRAQASDQRWLADGLYGAIPS